MTTIAVVTGNPKPNSRTHGVAQAVADALAKKIGESSTDRLVIDLEATAGSLIPRFVVSNAAGQTVLDSGTWNDFGTPWKATNSVYTVPATIGDVVLSVVVVALVRRMLSADSLRAAHPVFTDLAGAGRG